MFEPPSEPLRDSRPSHPSQSGLKRRKQRQRRRLFAIGLSLTPAILHVGTDFLRRGSRILAFRGEDAWAYLGTVGISLLIGLLFVHAVSRRNSILAQCLTALFVIHFTLALGGQTYFYGQYNAYLNEDVSVFASNLMDSVFNQLLADLANYLKANAPALVAAILIVFFARRVLRPRRLHHRVVSAVIPLTLIGVGMMPVKHRQVQAATPDVLYMNAVAGLVRTQLGLTEQAGQIRPRARESLPVPRVTATPTRPRNVILLQLESVRAEATCVGYQPGCRRTETTNRLFPKRYPLRQMRSLDSCTAISSAVLWGGMLPTESRETLHTRPLIFDFARAAGYHTAYFTAQNMMFGNARLWVKNLGVERFLSATDFDPESDLDMGAPEKLVADRLIDEFRTLPEPYFVIVQLSNVHYPYYVDPKLPRPFQPASLSKAPEDLQLFYNYYQNSVYQQDLHVGRLLSEIRNTTAGKRTVVVYTSDHAESFREHGNLGHTFSILDSEVRVPGWIDAPDGTLTDEEVGALRSAENVPTNHLDLHATMMDLLGLWKTPELASFMSQVPGDSLLRKERQLRMLPMTNCAWVWSCAFENWGVMHGERKLEAREWDHDWHCYDLATDPKEKNDLGSAACPNLVDFAMKTFGRRPGELKQRAAAAAQK
ncbi:MAG: sulfatase-like hydrolase/transferase [Polyangiaceae bacterium]